MDQFAGYIFDLDGTIYLGDHVIEGAPETIRHLQSLNRKLLFLTNKTIESREYYVQKLRRFGIDVTIEHLLSPAVVTIRHLHAHYPNARVYVIGEKVFKDELERNGIRFARSPEETDLVVISWDRDFHYRHLDHAYQAIVRGAEVIATHPDRTCPMPGGAVPDCGGMIGAIEGVTGQKVEVIMGKPSSFTAYAALDILGVEASSCLMTGDRLETDILMGNQAGMNTALVLTGVTKRTDLQQSAIQPTFVLESVREIMSVKRSGK